MVIECLCRSGSPKCLFRILEQKKKSGAKGCFVRTTRIICTRQNTNEIPVKRNHNHATSWPSLLDLGFFVTNNREETRQTLIYRPLLFITTIVSFSAIRTPPPPSKKECRSSAASLPSPLGPFLPRHSSGLGQSVSVNYCSCPPVLTFVDRPPHICDHSRTRCKVPWKKERQCPCHPTRYPRSVLIGIARETTP